MDVVTITCPRCGHVERYPDPDAVRERKDCPGCLADEFIRSGLLYRVHEFGEATSRTSASESDSREEQRSRRLARKVMGTRPDRQDRVS